MKILHTADWHIGQFKGPVVDGVNLRSQDARDRPFRCNTLASINGERRFLCENWWIG